MERESLWGQLHFFSRAKNKGVIDAIDYKYLHLFLYLNPFYSKKSFTTYKISTFLFFLNQEYECYKRDYCCHENNMWFIKSKLYLIQITTYAVICFVTLGFLFNFSERQFTHVYNGGINTSLYGE